MDKDKVNQKELLIQAINVRWNSFYHILVKGDPKFVLELQKYIEMSANERRKALETEVIIENLDNEIRHILSYFKSESDLWAFLSNKNNFNIISNIADSEVYRRVC